MPHDAQRLLSWLDDGQFERIVGVEESSHIEFKGEPYRLQVLYGRHELAKDVTALANAHGGVIIVGVRTKKHEVHPVDVASEIREIPSNRIDVQQHYNILSEWVYPVPTDIAITWHPSRNCEDQGLLSILVLPQAESLRPFLVKRAMLEETIKGTLVGYFERHESSANPAAIEEIQQLMRDGLLFREFLDRRSGRRIATQAPGEPLPSQSAMIELGTSRLSEVINLVGFTTEATYALIATPEQPIDATAIFNRESAVTDTLRHPPELRSSGFDLDTGFEPEIIEGTQRRTLSPGYKGLAFWRDGILIFAAPGNNFFLAWGNHATTAPYAINPISLIESVLLFCMLAKQLYDHCHAQNVPRRIALHLSHMCVDNQPPLLWPGIPGIVRFRGDAKVAPSCDVEVHIESLGTEEPEVTAYRLVAELYAWFGLEREAIPYIDRARVHPAVNVREIIGM
jgi:hypothetical protein